MLKQEQIPEIKVKNVSRNFNLRATIVEVVKPKLVKNGTLTLRKFIVQDKNGDQIGITTWGDDYKHLQTENQIIIYNAYTTEWNGEVSLGINKGGKIEVVQSS